MGHCRICASPLTETFVDLGHSPLANSYLNSEDLHKMEPHYPLHVYVCSKCFLVQIGEVESPDHIFRDYAYFSSFSASWLEHARAYAEMMVARFALKQESLVLEIASNDGYLLRWFQQQGIPVLGVEPAENVAQVARKRGIPTRAEFFHAGFASQLQAEGVQADVIAANNVVAHVPNLLEFLKGIQIALKPRGVATLEFPHVLNLIQQNQFDTIYHEHFSYLSLLSLEKALAMCELSAFDVELLPTHGGSLRVFVRHHADESKSDGDGLLCARKKETEAKLHTLDGYADFGKKAVGIKTDVLTFLIVCQRTGKKIVGYGAPAKGNTLLNYCGVGPELLPFTVDQSPHKAGLFLPGVHIPIYSPDRLLEERPDYVVILPWNLRDEISQQMSGIRSWGGQFVTFIPHLEIF
ncbi:MAG: class I SAM-dependent methyltransferase [Acidobacteriota bacterium]